jgi:hypothetical protein
MFSVLEDAGSTAGEKRKRETQQKAPIYDENGRRMN